MPLASPLILADEAFRGPATAPVTSLQYGDFECPYCLNTRFIVDNLLRAFPGQLRYVFRHFPNTTIHPQAMLCAQAAVAAAEQSYFWKMYDALFDHQNRLNEGTILEIVDELGLDVSQFLRRWRDPMIERDLKEGFREAKELFEVTGTPTFFINGIRQGSDWTSMNLWQGIQASLNTSRAALNSLNLQMISNERN